MDFEQARFNMVEQQIRTWKPLNATVVDVLHVLQREDFVPSALRQLALADTQLPLPQGAVMLEPKIEARALFALAIKSHENILEIGSGSGFMAALLAAHAEHVWSLEIDPELAALARSNLSKSGIDNVIVEVADGLEGWRAHAPYDAIMVSGGLPSVPKALLSQLKKGGRLFAIVGKAPLMQAQLITRIDEGKQYSTKVLFETSAPLLKNVASLEPFRF